ncbi:MerR family transcriptional regulator [Actinomadura rudentiformis]|uniref:MerR family transcriptional regulator n=1 Tax=Actinomadura rudentiformis TaxID=359158 RepID=A0A6H9YG91_9ACTN|nr:MerR family transcriptional regulator [Actinomadura rudentiformis]KAB2344714.1 MerR family transcriptional regulator [Actinomadura rudentiformis]
MKSSVDVVSMSIGEVAAHFGLATHVLRHWESMGLLAPARITGDRRRYGTGDLYRIAIILRAKEGGLGLEDIRAMLMARDPAERRAVLRKQRAELVRRITEAQASLHLIDCGLNCEHDELAECPNFRAEIAARARLPVPVPADLVAGMPPRPAVYDSQNDSGGPNA